MSSTKTDISTSLPKAADLDLASLQGPSISEEQSLPTPDIGKERARLGLMQSAVRDLQAGVRAFEKSAKKGSISAPQSELLRQGKRLMTQATSALRYSQDVVEEALKNPNFSSDQRETAKAAQTLVKVQKLNSEVKKFKNLA